MSSADSDPQAARSMKSPRAGFWIRELPFSLVLALTMLGVAYTSVSKQPIIAYWELLAPIIGLVCIGAGWRSASDQAARLRLIWTQALHWLAFLVAMNMLLLPSVQKILNASATGLAIFALLALGAFTAGVHARSWQVCVLGLIMALAIPAVAWIENSALILVLIAAVALGVAAALWWRWRDRSARQA